MELRQGAFIAFFEKVRLKGGTRVPMTDINLRQLEIFVAIVDYGSFTEAAKRLYLAQSTVSSHVRALEESLHVVLFRRKSKRNMVLTPDGKRVYQYARDILAKCTALRSDVMGDPRRELSRPEPSPRLSGGVFRRMARLLLHAALRRQRPDPSAAAGRRHSAGLRRLLRRPAESFL